MTLVEVIFAVVVLSVVLTAAFPMIVMGSRLCRTARNQYIAVTLAQNQMERAGVFNYSELYLLAENAVQMDENGSPSSEGDFRRTTMIATNVFPNVTQVSVNVEIRSIRTGVFDGQCNGLTNMFVKYNQ